MTEYFDICGTRIAISAIKELPDDQSGIYFSACVS